MTLPLREALQSLLAPAFTLDRELGGGGMSRVFVAQEPALKREVVVKVLPSDLFSSRSAERFQHEVEVTARLQHPHILPVVTAGGSERLRFYVVPYIAGGSLKDRLASGERLTLEAAVTLLSELLSAVAFAHERGIVHRDIKPANVLIAEGHAVLADFGIAQAVAAAQAMEGLPDSSVAPPAAYLAPERPTGTSADLYATAALACELLIGEIPAAGVAAADVLAALRRAHPAGDLRQLRALADVLAQALAVAPARRFRTASDLRQALLAAATRHQRRPVAAVAGTAALATLAVVAVVAFSPSRETPRAAPVLLPRVTPDSSAPIAQLPAPLPAFAPDTAPAAPPAAPGASTRLQAALATAWSGSPVEQAQATEAALAVLEERATLEPVEVSLAEGVVALGRRQFVAACEAFDAAREREESYAAWMGAAECRVRDSAVVSLDGRMMFRGDLYTAAIAYREAARLGGAQRALAYNRLPNVLFVDAARVRRGFDESGRVMLGQAVAAGDSIGFEVFAPGPRRVTPEAMASNARAIALARNLLRPALVEWITVDSTSVRARKLLIELLESTGHVQDAAPDGLRALDQVRLARAMRADVRDSIELARAHVRLLLRAGEFAAAARIADSTLSRYPTTADDADAEVLLSLAMVTGKVARATQLMEQVSGRPGRQLQVGDGRLVDVPVSAYRARAEFLVGGTLGSCTPAVREGPARLQAVVDAMFPTGERPRGAEGAFLERPMLLALPCLGPESFRALRDPTHPIARALQAPDGGIARAVGVLEGMQRARQGPGGPGFDPTETALIAAHVYLLHDDTAAAIDVLDRPLNALPLMPNVFLHTELLAGSLPRVIALRAELAMLRGERELARRWAGAVTALWANADAELQPTVRRLRAALSAGP